MPTMRSPGTAPSAAKLTGRSPRKPLIGMLFAPAGGARSLLLLEPGQRNFRPMTLPRPNQPSSARLTLRRRFGASLGVSSGQAALMTSAEDSSPRLTAAITSSGVFCESRLSEDLLAEPLAAPAEGTLEDFAAELAILGARRIARGPPDRRARLAGDGEALPGGRRRLHLGGDDLHLVAVPELGDERHRPSIDLAADAGVADVGVHRIGEVDGVGAARERDQPALGREAEHLILEQLELGVLEKLFRVVAFEQHVDEMPQPAVGVALMARQHAVLRDRPIGGILVQRMRRHAIFGNRMHALGAEL